MLSWGATMIGALLGIGIQMHSNAVDKLPYMRRPGMYVTSMWMGVIFVNALVRDYEMECANHLDKKAKAANERRYIDEDK